MTASNIIMEEAQPNIEPVLMDLTPVDDHVFLFKTSMDQEHSPTTTASGSPESRPGIGATRILEMLQQSSPMNVSLFNNVVTMPRVPAIPDPAPIYGAAPGLSALVSHPFGQTSRLVGGIPPIRSPMGLSTPIHYNVDATNDIMRMLQPNKLARSIPFIPHNAYSIDPITGAMVPPVARDIVPQGLPLNRVPAGIWDCIQRSNVNMPRDEDEEARGLSGFDRILYTRSEVARRVACEEYNHLCKRNGFDLTISMPVQVPYGNIIVDANSGEHYYGITGENASDKHPHAVHVLFGRGLPEEETMSYHETADDAHTHDIPDFSASKHPSACDVWSSFLRVKLGVIYNVRQDQLRIVTESLKHVMSGLTFDKPLEFNAQGIYANGSVIEGILQSPPLYDKGVKYVTHLRPKSIRDQERFMAIRQRIKCFAYTLGFHFGTSIGGVNVSHPGSEYQPPICVEFECNMTSERIVNGLVQIEIRSYNFERNLDQSLKDEVWSPVDGHANPYQNTTKDSIISKVEATEIRVEHDRGHCVDPRWPRDLIIARRIVSHGEAYQRDSPENTCRHVFCPFPSPQQVGYRGKFKDLGEAEEPQFITGEKMDADLIRTKLKNSRFKREFLNHLKHEPQSILSPSSLPPVISPVHAPLPRPYLPPAPIHTLSVPGGWNIDAIEFKPSREGTHKPQEQNRGIRSKRAGRGPKVKRGGGSLPKKNQRLPHSDGAVKATDVV